MSGKLRLLAVAVSLALGGIVSLGNLPTAQAQSVRRAVYDTARVAVAPARWWDGYRWAYRPYWYGPRYYSNYRPYYRPYYAPYYPVYPRYYSYYNPGPSYSYPVYGGSYYW